MLMLKACGWNREFQFDKNWNTFTQVIWELRKMACYYIDSRSYQRYNSYLNFQYIRLTLSSNNFHPLTILSLNQTQLRVHLTFLILRVLTVTNNQLSFFLFCFWSLWRKYHFYTNCRYQLIDLIWRWFEFWLCLCSHKRHILSSCEKF